MNQKSLRDVSAALDDAMQAINEIEARSLYDNPPKLSFEQKIIDAVRQMDDGSPMKDFLSRDDMETAIRMLADVFTATGVKMPVDWA